MTRFDVYWQFILVVQIFMMYSIFNVAVAELNPVAVVHESVSTIDLLLPEKPEQAGQSEQIGVFMTVEEQQAAEIKRSQRKDDEVNPLAVALDTNNTAEDSLTKKITKAPSLAKKSDSSPRVSVANDGKPRYDGVVLRDGKVLGIWINKQRFRVFDGEFSMQLDAVNSSGQAQFSGTLSQTGQRGVADLYPGGIIPFSISLKDDSHAAGALNTEVLQ